MSRNCLPQCQQVQGATERFVGRSTPVGVEHRAASQRLVSVGDLNTTNSPVQETQVDVSATIASSIPATIPAQRADPVSTVLSSSEIRATQNHAQVVVPGPPGGIALHNSFEALRRNDEDDVPIDGHDVFFGVESDTESLPDSDRGDGEVVEEAIPVDARPRIVTIGLEALDGVDLSEEFHQRPHTMRSVPFTMRVCLTGVQCKGPLDEIIEGRHRRNVVKEERGWKLFFLIPRLLLFKPAARGGGVSRSQLEDRLRRFASGEWLSLLTESRKVSEAATDASVRKRRRGAPIDESRAVRAEQLASLGELSAARRALEGAVLAPGTLATLAELTNPVRRPPRPRDPLPPEILGLEPEESVRLDEDQFAKNIRSARRGAAPDRPA